MCIRDSFTTQSEALEQFLDGQGVCYLPVATTTETPTLVIKSQDLDLELGMQDLLDHWSVATDALEKHQTTPENAVLRAKNRGRQPLKYHFAEGLSFARPKREENRSGVTAAIIRDKGTNGEREMAYALYLAGFDVKDVHMTDLMSGRETLEGVQLIVFCGGFSHSDVLGSAKMCIRDSNKGGAMERTLNVVD